MALNIGNKMKQEAVTKPHMVISNGQHIFWSHPLVSAATVKFATLLY